MRVHRDWLLTPERAAIHIPTATAVIADLHLGYDRVRCRAGDALPEFGIEDAIAVLGSLLRRHPARRLVIAGDLCEDGRCPEAMQELVDWLRSEDVELAGVVPGNHDRDLLNAGWSFPVFAEGMHVGEWSVVHGEKKLPPGVTIQGHEHPCLRWQRRISAPCFLVGRRRIVLPAFSADASGVNVLGAIRWRHYRCCVPAGERVLDFGPVGLLAKREWSA
jgi:putative SbcD/Mre11-related phosphoesterase